MNNQRLRIGVAAWIVTLGILGTLIGTAVGGEIPGLYRDVVIAGVMFLFGVTTNGSGTGKNGGS